MRTSSTPSLPPGRLIDLPGRGTTFIREVQGPPGAATIILLHGWLATSGLNWHPAFAELGRRFHVIAIDHRGHGLGIRPRRGFRLTDCADDVAALVRLLRLGKVVVCGYSMGGPIAQLVWRRHPDVVGGLVLCATSREFPSPWPVRILYNAVGAGLALTPAQLRRRAVAALLDRGGRDAESRRWVAGEVAFHDTGALLEAGRQLNLFNSSAWVGEVDVPTTCIVTLRDELVPLAAQRQLAAAIPGATTHEVDGDHVVCVSNPRVFVPTLVRACVEVVTRMRAAQPVATRIA